MKHFDIDTCDPGYSREPLITCLSRKKKLTHRENVALRRTAYIRIHNHGRWNLRLGIRPETMLDWRGLERRMCELDAAWKTVNDEFWRVARDMPRPLGGVTVVVVDDPASGEDGVLKISEDGYSTDTKHRLVEDLVKDPRKEEEFTLIPYDQGGSKLGRLYNRMNRLQRAYGTYKLAFQRAVGDRLLKMREDMLRHDTLYGRAYYLPATFVIENEGRIYVITSGNGQNIQFHEGEVYSSTRSTNEKIA